MARFYLSGVFATCKSTSLGAGKPIRVYSPRKRFRLWATRILPPMKSIIDVATEANNFKILLSALNSAALIDMLRAPGQYTVFAPTDEAMRRLPPGALDAMFKDRGALRPFLCNHIMSGTLAANDILPGPLKPIEGLPLRASLDGSRILINGIVVIQPDLRASNGVIHAVEEALVPATSGLPAVA